MKIKEHQRMLRAIDKALRKEEETREFVESLFLLWSSDEVDYE